MLFLPRILQAVVLRGVPFRVSRVGLSLTFVVGASLLSFWYRIW